MSDYGCAMGETTRTEYRTCPLCEATCGLEIEIAGEAVRRIRGDRDDVFSHGFICPKGSTLKHLHEDPDRLRNPLVKRNGVHEEVTWDEAWAAIENGLGPHLDGDRNAIGIYLGNPNVHNLAAGLFGRVVIKAIGTRNIYSASTVDQMPRHTSSGYLYGDPLAMPVPDLDRTDHIVLLGSNPAASNGSLCTAPDFCGRLDAIRERGGDVVLIDPRRTETAKHASEHLFIRPGTDAFLLAAIVNTLFREDLVSLGVAEEVVDNIDEVRAAVESHTVERASTATGIDADRIAALAHDLAAADSGVVFTRLGVHGGPFGTVCSYLGDIATILTGNLDTPGGLMWPLAAHASVPAPSGTKGRDWKTGRFASRVSGRPEVNSELPVAVLPEEILTPGDGQIRAMVTLGGNPCLSCPDSQNFAKAFEQLDFMVSVDVYLNETTRHADVILPAHSALEKSHYDVAFYGLAVRNVANWSPAVFDADGPTDGEVLARLGMFAMGLGIDADVAGAFDMGLRSILESAVRNEAGAVHGRDVDELIEMLEPGAPEDRMVDAMVRCGAYGDGFGADPDGLSLARMKAHPHGIDLGPLQPRLGNVVKTQSGRIDLAPSPIIAELGRLDSAESADSEEGALRLIGRRHVRSNNSWMHNVNVLVKGRDRCTLMINPLDAEAHRLSDGDEVAVTSAVGSVVAPVEITDDVMAGVVSLPHGWGHDAPGAQLSVAATKPGVNLNVLTDPGRLDEPSGNAVLNAIPVTLSPA